MFEDPYFNNLVKERLEYFNDNLNTILSKIDDYETYLEKSQKKNIIEDWKSKIKIQRESIDISLAKGTSCRV